MSAHAREGKDAAPEGRRPSTAPGASSQETTSLPATDSASLLRLQRAAGNAAVAATIGRGPARKANHAATLEAPAETVGEQAPAAETPEVAERGGAEKRWAPPPPGDPVGDGGHGKGARRPATGIGRVTAALSAPVRVPMRVQRLGMPHWASSAVDAAASAGGKVVHAGEGAASSAWDTASGVADSAWNTASSAASSAWGTVTGIGGLIAGGVKKLAQKAFGWVKSAYKGVRSFASKAVSKLRGWLESGAKAIEAGFKKTINGVVTGFSAAKKTVGRVIGSAKDGVGNLLKGVLAPFNALKKAILGLDASGVQKAWGRIVQLSHAVGGGVSRIATGIRHKVGEGWRSILGQGRRARDSASSSGSGLVATAGRVVSSLTSGLGGIWSSLLGKISGVLRKLIPGWSSIERMWSSIWAGVKKAASAIVAAARRVWDTLKKWASRAWKGLQTAVKAEKKKSNTALANLVKKAKKVPSTVGGGAIGGLVDACRKVGGFFKQVKNTLKRKPAAAIGGLAKAIAGRLSDLPPRVLTEAQQRVLARAPGGGGGGASAAAAAAPAGGGARSAAGAPALTIQRAAAADAMGTLTADQTVSTLWTGLRAKVEELMPKLASILGDTLVSMVWPPATVKAIGHDISDCVKDLKKTWNSLSLPRIDSLGHFWDDIRRFGSHLADFALIIWRAANSVAGRLSLYIALAMVLGGAAVGSLAGGVGAIPGAIAGGAAALEAGKVLFLSYVGAETASFAKAAGDLLFVPQTRQEQADDADRSADNVIGLTIAGILAALTMIGSRIAGDLVEAIRTRIGPEELPPEEVPPEGGGGDHDPGGGGRDPNEQAPDPEELPSGGPPTGRVPLERVRYSQSTVSATMSDGRLIAEVAEDMRKNGWDETKPPPDMVDWGDGGYQTLDHRRLMAALQAGLKDVPTDVHPATEPLPLDQQARFQLQKDFTDPVTGQEYHAGDLPKTWGEAAMGRAAKQGSSFPLRGSPDPPRVTGGGG